MTYKFLNIADTNLISGSSELIRQEFRAIMFLLKMLL